MNYYEKITLTHRFQHKFWTSLRTGIYCAESELVRRYGYICATLTNETRFSTVGESSEDIKVKLVPNPMSGISYLFVDKDTKTMVDIRIFDQSGRLLQQFKSSNNKVPIQLAKEASGVYIVECKVGNNVIHKKLIKS